MKSKTWWLGAVLAFALVAAACGTSDDTTTTAAQATTTTAAAVTTTVTPDAGFEGLVLDAGGCEYGGRVESITAVDEFTVEFDLCGAHPATTGGAMARQLIWEIWAG